VYTISKDRRSGGKAKSNLRDSLWSELATNVDTIFDRGVDRPLLFDAIRSLRKSFVNEVKDTGVLAGFQDLYLELEHYSKFVEKVYLTNSGIDRRAVTERQLITCNAFLSHFNEEPVSYSLTRLQASNGNSYIEGRKAIANKRYLENYEKWVTQLSDEVSKLI
jgi:hypothetical protein